MLADTPYRRFTSEPQKRIIAKFGSQGNIWLEKNYSEYKSPHSSQRLMHGTFPILHFSPWNGLAKKNSFSDEAVVTNTTFLMWKIKPLSPHARRRASSRAVIFNLKSTDSNLYKYIVQTTIPPVGTSKVIYGAYTANLYPGLISCRRVRQPSQPVFSDRTLYLLRRTKTPFQCYITIAVQT